MRHLLCVPLEWFHGAPSPSTSYPRCRVPMCRTLFRQAFYSTPQQYTEAKHASGVHLTVKKDDFFPYADCPVRSEESRSEGERMAEKRGAWAFDWSTLH